MDVETRLVRRVLRAVANGAEDSPALARAALDPPSNPTPRRFCLFLGYPRSGHSLVGALLDAHPDALISNELNALRLVGDGISRDELLTRIVSTSRRQAARGRRGGGRYRYEIANGWQGNLRTAHLLGDNMAGRSSLMLTERPDLLGRLVRLLEEVRLQIVHVVRNPFDNCATHMRRARFRRLRGAIREYRTMNRTVKRFRSEWPSGDWITLRHEDLVANPRTTLLELLVGLGLPVSETYLDACRSIVDEKPHASRHRVEWSDDDRKALEEEIARTNYLSGYAFDT